MALRLVVVNLPSNNEAFTNRIYLSDDDVRALNPRRLGNVYVDVKGFVFLIEGSPKLQQGQIAFNKVHREAARIGLNSEVVATPYDIPKNFELSYIKLQVDHLQKQAGRQEIKGADLEPMIREKFTDHVFQQGSGFVLDYESTLLRVTVNSVLGLDSGGQPDTPGVTTKMGIFCSQTEIDFQNGATLHVLTNKSQQRTVFRPDFNFADLGIGGLDKEFGDIFRRAFASRVFPPHVVRNLGINHVRGMLLFGPPGTGKTLLARQIGKMLKAAEPKIINGPEVLNKYVGQSEENIRNLFADAEKEYKRDGEESQLHIIIFDELDAICKPRGSGGGTGVQDGVVNQLLSKIDGVDALNNILLIGMTNRIDMIDEALLRPGRMEVHMEISLPTKEGRHDILKIHTKKMREHNYLKGVDLEKIAADCKNFSGAELEGIVRAATSYALNAKVNVKNIGSKMDNLDMIEVTNEYFEMAKQDIKPAFGAKDDSITPFLGHGIIEYSTAFQALYDQCKSIVSQVRETDTPLLSMLLEGPPGSGKTALAVHLAKDSDYPFIRVITPNDYVGMGELSRITAIGKAFDDAYKSSLSVVVLDNIERLLNYTPIGPRFDNMVLQGIQTMLRKQPPMKTRKLLIIATSSSKDFLDQAEVTQNFHINMHVPVLSRPKDIAKVLSKQPGFHSSDAVACAEVRGDRPIGIQQLITAAEMATFKSKNMNIPLKQAFLDSNF